MNVDVEPEISGLPVQANRATSKLPESSSPVPSSKNVADGASVIFRPASAHDEMVSCTVLVRRGLGSM